MPEDLGTLRGIYERLIQRHRTYAADSQIADAILYFLEEENTHTKEANMMIVRVQGENDIFAPCQRMATAIAEALKSKGSCTQSDVAAKGFSAEEIKRQILQREEFNNRYTNNVPIGMHEMLYPLMQGYDSLALNIDVEMGGTDQLFNCQMGRALQEGDGKPGQIVVSMPLLVGLDGKEKMSKSHHNYIGLTEAPNDMYGKTMSMPDHLMANYLELATDLPLPEVNRLKSEIDAERIHPMDVKKIIAHNIVTQYHSQKDADAAAEFFCNQFQKKDDAEKSYKEIGIESIFGGEDSMNLVDLCAKLQPQMSKSQIRRLIASNAITIDGKRASDPLAKVSAPGEEPLKLRIGKRGFFALTPKVG